MDVPTLYARYCHKCQHMVLTDDLPSEADIFCGKHNYMDIDFRDWIGLKTTEEIRFNDKFHMPKDCPYELEILVDGGFANKTDED